MEASSPAALAGLIAHDDFIVGADQVLQDVSFLVIRPRQPQLPNCRWSGAQIPLLFCAVRGFLLSGRSQRGETPEAAGVQH